MSVLDGFVFAIGRAFGEIAVGLALFFLAALGFVLVEYFNARSKRKGRP